MSLRGEGIGGRGGGSWSAFSQAARFKISLAFILTAARSSFGDLGIKIAILILVSVNGGFGIVQRTAQSVTITKQDNSASNSTKWASSIVEIHWHLKVLHIVVVPMVNTRPVVLG
jgi:hypothetical protein